MKEKPMVLAAIVLASALFGAVVGAFLVGTALSFAGNPSGALYGGIAGALVGAGGALLQVRRGSGSSDGAA